MFDSHAQSASAPLSLLPGVRGLEDGVLRQLRELQENNWRHLAHPTATAAERPISSNGETASGVSPHRDQCPSGRHALAIYRTLAQKLRGLEGNLRATRIIRRAECDAECELNALGARLARHAGQSCSVTGVRIQGVELVGEAGETVAPCEPVRSANAAIPGNPHSPGMGGVYSVPGHCLQPGLHLRIALKNILGHPRPIVPVFVQIEFEVGLHAPYRYLATDEACVFVFAMDLAPGSSTALTISTKNLFDTLPGPIGLIHAARLVVWLPSASDMPEPLPHLGAIPADRSHLRLVA